MSALKELARAVGIDNYLSDVWSILIYPQYDRTTIQYYYCTIVVTTTTTTTRLYVLLYVSYVAVVFRNFFCDRHTLRTHCRRAYICSTASSSNASNSTSGSPRDFYSAFWICNLILYNAFDKLFLLEAADKWSAIRVPLLLFCNTRLAQLRRLKFQFQSVLATLRAFDAEKCSISCTNIYFIPVSYSLTSELWFSGPAEAAHVGGGGPFTP